MYISQNYTAISSKQPFCLHVIYT